MIFFNWMGLIGVVAAGGVAGLFMLAANQLGISTDGIMAAISGIVFCLVASIYAFTFDRCDEQGIGAFHLNCKNAFYSAWANHGADWATDPRRSGFQLHPGRRLCLFILPLALSIFIPLPLSVFLWLRDAAVENPWGTNTQHAIVFSVSLVALVVALIYARLTRKLRRISPLPKSPW